MTEIIWFDIVTLGVILIVGIKGIFNGLIKEIAGLLGIISGVFIASSYAEDFGMWIGSNIIKIDSQTALNMIGFLTLLTLIWLTFILAGILLSKLISISGMGIIDKLFGFIFAGGKIFVIVSAIVYALSNIEIIKKTTEKYVAESFMYPLYYETGKFIINIDPEKVKNEVNEIQKKAKKSVEKSAQTISNHLSSQKGLE
ncbi:CvpA family protein [Hydrogenimonas thermophila]|uniref:Membrane protein required for colicin V production n=1 Tax=Hydrogenimonas thermophila TaxID=223786 RepID=A0A1I5MK47_9BACT|nr:CvpA family protein [Hydrogenimonas thermophila]WOE70923.1 CvpA family protein [Hydrogenimonas thermophila]WOE73441.1 CvpA family protein [Hydrogenimonas thermophila]SFP09677.1 membrane protein required for colicin V production [Hydrogenimonas thermophila]